MDESYRVWGSVLVSWCLGEWQCGGLHSPRTTYSFNMFNPHRKTWRPPPQCHACPLYEPPHKDRIGLDASSGS